MVGSDKWTPGKKKEAEEDEEELEDEQPLQEEVSDKGAAETVVLFHMEQHPKTPHQRNEFQEFRQRFTILRNNPPSLAG